MPTASERIRALREDLEKAQLLDQLEVLLRDAERLGLRSVVLWRLGVDA